MKKIIFNQYLAKEELIQNSLKYPQLKGRADEGPK